MDKLDRLITERLADRLLTPSASRTLLAGLMERQAARNEDHAARLSALKTKLANAETRLGRLYAAIESSIADINDATLKETRRCRESRARHRENRLRPDFG